MAKFPKVDSPCPYKNNLAAVLDGDFCRMCKRDVFDLDAMDDVARTVFLAGCSGEVCVRYTLPVRPAFAAAALAMTAIAAPAYAQDAPAADSTSVPEDMYIIVGGIADPAHAEMIEDPADATIPELPVVYEEAAPRREDDETAPGS